MPGGKVMETQVGWQSRRASGVVLARGFCLGEICSGLLCCGRWDQRSSWSPARLQRQELVTALESQRSSRWCEVVWQSFLCRRPAPALVIYLIPRPYAVPELGCVVSGESVCAGVLLPLGRAWTGLRIPFILGPCVGFACKRSRRTGMAISDRSKYLGKKCSWVFGCSVESCTGKSPPHCHAPFRVRWELTPARLESGEQRLGSRGLPPALHRDVSQAVF